MFPAPQVAGRYDPAVVRAVLNASFGYGRAGEIVEVDPVLWAVYFRSGRLSLVDDDGRRLRSPDGTPLSPDTRLDQPESDPGEGPGPATPETPADVSDGA